MRKIFLSAFLSLAVIFSAAGCAENSTAQKAVEQSKLSIAAGDYPSALNFLKLAQNEGDLSDEVVEQTRMLENFLKAKEEFAQHQSTKAEEFLKLIPDNYKNYSFAADIDKLKAEMAKGTGASQNIDEQIAAVRNWIASGDYASAALNITELYTKAMNDNQRKQADELRATLETAKSKIASAESAVAKSAAPSHLTYTEISGNKNVVATYYVVNCKRSITLRTYPSTSADAITQIPLGQAVGYIENAGNGFYKINYDGLVGYSLASYLSSSRSSGSSGGESFAQVVNCQEWITLRSEPSTSAASLARIPLGAYVTYLGPAGNGFYYIEYNGRRGYGLQQYLRVR